MAVSVNNQQTRSGMNIFAVAGVVLIILKLTGVVTFSWWWVTAPFWGPPAVVAAIFLPLGAGWLLTLAFFAIQQQFKNLMNRKKIAEAKERQERVSFHS